MSRTRVLITGAGGFIGGHLAKRLYGLGSWVRGTDVKWDGYIDDREAFSEKYTHDLRDPLACELMCRDIDHVFNLAANMGGIGFITTERANVCHDNVLINANMLRAAVRAGVKRYFFSSSACVYPAYRQTQELVEPLREDMAMPADPDSFYGWEKFYSEKMCEAFRLDYLLPVVMVRYHNIYGPQGTWNGGREKAPAALCRKVAEAKDGDSLAVWGDGQQTRSFCYIDDCIDGTLSLMMSDFPWPLNIGSDRLVSIEWLAREIIKISGKRLTLAFDVGKPQGVRGRNADLTKVREVLGWEPKVSLEEGLRRTYEWIERQVHV